MKPMDHSKGRTFSDWALEKMHQDDQFHRKIIFSDEAHFWLNGTRRLVRTSGPPLLLLKKPVTVLQGVSLINQTGPVKGYTTGLRLAYYGYSPD
ncbi:hypothetical protein TNIN_103691 [Trichonephila inaurata madagascariensis]|uniref:Transposase n=1 Tax=Trichonephila inaurata madagascariensis TaxID=2747483 RepID=A0A8X6WQJ9_9ARAC|nr:hypothetical protein TNIN_103691 [Trichonephila inaurata madagascariensis]